MKYTLIKTCTYALMHMGVSITVAYFLTGSWKIALAIGAVEPFAQIIAYFIHESAWHAATKETTEHVKHFCPCCTDKLKNFFLK